jgi:dihydrofolate reductase
MRTITNSTYITLDGVIQDPQNWPATGGFTETGNRMQQERLEACDAVVMGRHTYEMFAPVFSAMSGDPVSDRMNALPKYVVSSTLTEPAWHNTIVIDRDPVEAVRELKEQPGADIMQYGVGRLTHALMGAGLLDELRLWVHPFMLGTGTTDDLLYRPGLSGRFDLVDSTALDSGIVVLTYRTAGR